MGQAVRGARASTWQNPLMDGDDADRCRHLQVQPSKNQVQLVVPGQQFVGPIEVTDTRANVVPPRAGSKRKLHLLHAAMPMHVPTQQLGTSLAARRDFVLDPMPITGATAVAAMDILKAWGEGLKPTGKTLPSAHDEGAVGDEGEGAALAFCPEDRLLGHPEQRPKLATVDGLHPVDPAAPGSEPLPGRHDSIVN